MTFNQTNQINHHINYHRQQLEYQSNESNANSTFSMMPMLPAIINNTNDHNDDIDNDNDDDKQMPTNATNSTSASLTTEPIEKESSKKYVSFYLDDRLSVLNAIQEAGIAMDELRNVKDKKVRDRVNSVIDEILRNAFAASYHVHTHTQYQRSAPLTLVTTK